MYSNSFSTFTDAKLRQDEFLRQGVKARLVRQALCRDTRNSSPVAQFGAALESFGRRLQGES